MKFRHLSKQESASGNNEYQNGFMSWFALKLYNEVSNWQYWFTPEVKSDKEVQRIFLGGGWVNFAILDLKGFRIGNSKGVGVSKAKIFKRKYSCMKLNWNFYRDAGFKPKTTCGGGMDFFWNNTFLWAVRCQCPFFGFKVSVQVKNVKNIFLTNEMEMRMIYLF